MNRHDLIIVANRLPLRRVQQGEKAKWVVSPGGLVSSLVPLLEGSGGAWVGWNGSAGGEHGPRQHGNIDLVPVPLSKSEIDDVYHGFSNRTLWPLYHDAVRWPEYHRQWWGPYRAVNHRFAEAAAGAAAPGATVWIHDYHLQLVPGMLRRMRPDLRIGFFLHIPFPPHELFAQLPWRREILEGMLGADVVGFQTPAGVRNFSLLAKRFTGARGSTQRLNRQGREVRVDSFPISIDFDLFEQLSRDPRVLSRAARLREKLGADRKIILGVDRLDYTKGIDIRLRAFRELLLRGDFTLQDCVLVQTAVPTRERVVAYTTLKQQVEMLVGRINGEFADVGRVAVHYLHRSLPPEELVALYVAADVLLVTPLRDGMNLIAKEYVAARRDDTGILVLSEFAGAALELRKALLVNPHDIDGVATALDRALRMTAAEERDRMRKLRSVVRAHDVHDWGRRFLGALGYGAPSGRGAGPAPGVDGVGQVVLAPEEAEVRAE